MKRKTRNRRKLKSVQNREITIRKHESKTKMERAWRSMPWWCRAKPNREGWNREESKDSRGWTRHGAEWKQSQVWWCRKAWSSRRWNRRRWRSLGGELHGWEGERGGARLALSLAVRERRERERERYGFSCFLFGACGLTFGWGPESCNFQLRNSSSVNNFPTMPLEGRLLMHWKW